jgi:DNA-binding NtrC family response regulator
MPPEVQVGLLRVVEYRRVEPLGAGAGIDVDVRFLSATNEDIEGKALSGTFRADLLDRLREGGTVLLPPLCERLDDVPLLVQKFVNDAETRIPGALQRRVEPEAIALLLKHRWPGNLRELRDTVYDAVANHPDIEHLVPRHVSFRTLAGGNPDAHESSRSDANLATGALTTQAPPENIEDLVDVLNAFSAESLSYRHLAAALPRLERAYASLELRLLRTALLVTGRADMASPNSRPLIHPTMKLLTDDGALTASQAADAIKKIFKLSPESSAEALKDPLLQRAYEMALRLRPRRQTSEPNAAKSRVDGEPPE